MAKQSSSRMSKIAGRYMNINEEEFVELLAIAIANVEVRERFRTEIVSLAASVVSQDETKGQ